MTVIREADRINFAMLFIGCFLLPLQVFAAEDSLTRRDGYLLIWQSILRPVEDTKSSFDDINDDDPGAAEIRYGKRRGILEDETTFRPDDLLTLRDALLWIFRTRNVRELPDMKPEALPDLIAKYPVIEMNRPLDGRIATVQLLAIMEKLDGMLRAEVHEVSYYGEEFQGQGTAFGEKFDKNAITAAHRSLPYNTLVRVTNVNNDKSVVVRINDRGPYVDGRDMDLSEASFKKIAEGGGIIHATFERLGDKDLANPCSEKLQQYQVRITRDVRLFRGVPHEFAKTKQLILQSSRPFVVQSIDFPDGQRLRIQDFVVPGEKYRFTPDLDGLYVFHFGDTLGHAREMRMHAESCVASE